MQAKITQLNLPKFKKEEKPYDVRDTELTGFILRVLPSGRKVYYCQYARGKREKLGVVPILEPGEAREKAKKMLAGITLDEETPEEKRRKAKAHDLESFLDNVYEPWALENLKRGKMDMERLRTHFIDDLGNKKLHEVTPWLIEKWRTKRRKAGRAASTINRDVACLRAALSKAVEWNLLGENPLMAVKPLKTDKTGVVRYLSKTEEKRLRAALSARDNRLIKSRDSGNAWRKKRGYEVMPEITGPYGDYLTPLVLLSMNTGIRRGEALSLTWENVNLKNKLLTVSGDTAKSHHTRHIPLNTEAADVLDAWHRQPNKTGLVFTARDGKQLANVKKSWAGILAKSKITKFRWHDLRHHFASQLVMAGADLYAVKELLGHSTIAVTERYAHLAPEHMASTVALLNEAGG
ncbi:MAG: site-specific integrase [Pseudomonadota bacterium]